MCNYLEAAPALWNAGAAEPQRTWAQSSPIKYDTATVNNASSPETATATGIGWGAWNTRAIILQGNATTSTSAAALADSYSPTVGGVMFHDWYLASKDELNQMCKWQRGVAWTSDSTICNASIGAINTGLGAAGFEPNWYWSSTDYLGNAAGPQRFDSGGQNAFTKSSALFLRPIRAF
jgi:hypothetical protein